LERVVQCVFIEGSGGERLDQHDLLEDEHKGGQREIHRTPDLQPDPLAGRVDGRHVFHENKELT
jgi:hypothetical protein